MQHSAIGSEHVLFAGFCRPKSHHAPPKWWKCCGLRLQCLWTVQHSTPGGGDLHGFTTPRFLQVGFIQSCSEVMTVLLPADGITLGNVRFPFWSPKVSLSAIAYHLGQTLSCNHGRQICRQQCVHVDLQELRLKVRYSELAVEMQKRIAAALKIGVVSLSKLRVVLPDGQLLSSIYDEHTGATRRTIGHGLKPPLPLSELLIVQRKCLAITDKLVGSCHISQGRLIWHCCVSWIEYIWHVYGLGK